MKKKRKMNASQEPLNSLRWMSPRLVFELSVMFIWLIILIVSVVLGWVIIDIGDTVLVITVYGGFLLFRKVVQQGFALRHNTSMMQLVRKPMIELLEEMYPEDTRWLRQLLSRHITYDDFRLMIRQGYNDIFAEDRQWAHFRLMSLVRQQMLLQANQSAFRDALRSMLALRFEDDISWIDKVISYHQNASTLITAIRNRYPDFKDPLDWYEFLMEERVITLPRGGITVPIYQVTIEEISELIRTVLSQSFLNIDSVELAFNGTLEKWPEMNDILTRTQEIVSVYNTDGSRIIFNVQVVSVASKRDGMLAGFKANIARGVDVVFNIDSDTILDIDAISNAMSVLIARPEVVCLTGDVRVINALENFLTRMTATRYFYAFWVERAAQSFFNLMNCMSGPFLVIRAPNLSLIMDAWANQKFLGLQCTYGDDRHLTTLSLINGWASTFVPECIVWTDSPVLVSVWRRQQLRWNKSAYRENYEVISKGYDKLNWFLKLDLFYLTVFPYLVVGVIITVIARAALALTSTGPLAAAEVLLPYIITILVVNIVFQSLYGMKMTRDWKYVFSVAYVWLWFRHLIWLKVWALVRLKDTGWGTRTVEDSQKETQA